MVQGRVYRSFKKARRDSLGTAKGTPYSGAMAALYLLLFKKSDKIGLER